MTPSPQPKPQPIYVRTRRKPAFLHLKTIRLYGHAGADMPTTYLPKSEVEAEEAQDPLLHMVRQLDQAGALPAAQALQIYLDTQSEITVLAARATTRPHLQTAAQVMASIIPPKRAQYPQQRPQCSPARTGLWLRPCRDERPANHVAP